MNMNDDREFEEFAAAGEVEVGESDASNPAEKPAGEEEAKKPDKTDKPRRGPPKPAAKSAAEEGKGEGDGDEEEGKKAKPKPKAKPDAKDAAAGDADESDGGGEDEDGEGEGEEEDEKPKKATRKPSDRIRDLTRRLRESERQNATLASTLASRLDNLEKGGLPNGQGGGKSGAEDVPAPDPTDVEKYPLGHLDDRYIEDKLEWLAEQKAAKRADAALHRQQEAEQNQQAQRVQAALLEKVEDLATRGDELYDDFQENVVEAGMRGDWDLSQATFEAAHEVENGAQILYELSQDKKEAKRVAGLSNFQQMKFVEERDAEIGDKKKPRKIPKAGEPPANQARGANSRTQINPATDNLADFEKAWKLDEQGKN